jgi:hypothetical protein
MKKLAILFLFLFLFGGVMAMDFPIKVKATPGYEVKIYAWPTSPGPLLGLGNGPADEKGFFNTTFFSLNVPYNLKIFVIDNEDRKIRDSEFPDMGLDKAIYVNCLPENCTIVESFEEENTEEILSEVKETINSSLENESNLYMTGKAVFTKVGGTSGLGILGGFIFILLAIVAVVVFFNFRKRGPKVPEKVLDEDEKELEETEKKVKETEQKIKSVIEKKNRKKKIEEAKRKLAEEEAQLKRLEQGSEEAQRQKEVVKNAEEHVEKTKANSFQDENQSPSSDSSKTY